MGDILSTTKFANFSLNSENFFPENSLTVSPRVCSLKLEYIPTKFSAYGLLDN